MNDYSNYHSTSLKKIKHDAKVLSSITFNGLESEPVLVNGIEETIVFIYDKYSGTESLKYLIDKNELITYGDVIYRSNGEKWLVRTYEKDNPLYKQWVAKICQYTLKWYDEDSNFHEYPCVLDYNTKSNFGDKDDRTMTLPDGRRQVILHKDSHTSKIGRAKRFILGNEAFEVVDYDFSSDFGLVNLSLKSTLIDPSKDNVELAIADYYIHQHKYSLEHSYGNIPISIYLNQTIQLEFLTFKNNIKVNEKIKLSITDAQIGQIDDTGVFTPVSTGETEVIAEYMGIRKSIKIIVREIMINNYSVEFEGSPSITLGQTKEFTAVFKNNGLIIDESCSFGLFSENGNSQTDLASIVQVNHNKITLKANSNSKLGVVVLKVVSDNGLIEGQIKINIKGFI